MTSRAIFAVCVSACVLSGVPPAQAVDLNHVLTGYAVTSWTERDGLPLATVWAIAQDAEGYLWLGTNYGLVRFDGGRFTDWGSISPGTLPQLPVRALHVASDGTLWVGFDNGGGVVAIRRGRVEPISRQGMPRSVMALVEDRRGTLWAGTRRGLYSMRGGAWAKVTAAQGIPPDESILTTFTDSRGQFWVGAAGGLYNRKVATDDFSRVSEGGVAGVSEHPAGSLWVSDYVSGFARLGTPSGARLLSGRGYRLLHDAQRNLWVGTLGQGLWRLRDEGRDAQRSIERITVQTGLSSDGVQALLQDREGNIWVGTNEGLNRLSEHRLSSIVNAGLVRAVEAGGPGSMWVGTADGLSRFSTPAGRSRTRVGSHSAAVSTLHRDARGALWIADSDGLSVLSPGATQTVRVDRDQPLTHVTSIAADSDGRIWVLDRVRGLFRWNGRRLEMSTGVPKHDVSNALTLFGDSSGRLWMTLREGRLGVVGRSGDFRRYGLDDGLGTAEDQTLFTLFEDSTHVIWVGGSGGLSRLTGDRFVTVGREKGFPSNRLTAIIEDMGGDLWLGVDFGLMRLNRAEFQAAASSADHPLRYTLYEPSDGLAGTPVQPPGRNVAPADDGTLWFVTGRGLSIVDPRRLDQSGAAPRPVARIEGGATDDARVAATPGMALAPRPTRLRIDYTALRLTASSRVRFRYRLDGFDTGWVNAGTRRQATYTNLAPRRYEFRVEADDGSGWTEPGAAWAFTIRPAFYQTTAFGAACAIVFSLLFWVLWRFRLRLVQRRFGIVLAERLRVSREIHDTLLQSLIGVSLQLDNITHDAQLLSPSSEGQLARLRRQVEQYIQEARQSIWNLRSPLLESVDLAEALRATGERAVAEDGTVRFKPTVIGKPQPLPDVLEHQLLRIGHEAVANAVRHARARQIDLELCYREHGVTLRVADDGRGFDPNQRAGDADRHYGLAGMRERAAYVGGRLTISSAAGSGTAVEIVVDAPAIAALPRAVA